jgi:hypothetical protein
VGRAEDEEAAHERERERVERAPRGLARADALHRDQVELPLAVAGAEANADQLEAERDRHRPRDLAQ